MKLLIFSCKVPGQANLPQYEKMAILMSHQYGLYGMKEKSFFCTGDSSVKAKNMRHNPQVSICVDDESPPYAFVIIQGTAKLIEKHKDLLKWNTILGSRYMGEKLADVYGKRNAVEGSLIVEVIPTKMISDKDVAGW